MAFSKNSFEQIIFGDPVQALNKRQLLSLNNSWAGYFSEKIFPLIDEDLFSCMYTKTSGRYNTPVNIMVSLLIIKDLFGYTNEQILFELLMDLRFKYAIHCSGRTDAIVSSGSVSRFCTRLRTYKKSSGKDLYREQIILLEDELGTIMKRFGFSIKKSSRTSKALKR